VRTRVNGVWREADVWPGTSLLVFLREALGLYGSKNACEQGECGSCSVLLDGSLVCACLVLAAQADGHDVARPAGRLDRGAGLAARPGARARNGRGATAGRRRALVRGVL